MVWDIFISHASEDKDAVARPLADKLIQHGCYVWYDEYTLTLGDSLRRSIDKGLAASRYGLVILSPHFFEKEWPQKELDGLVAREDGSEKRILPVWHNVSWKDVVSFSPPLAEKLGVSTMKGLEHVVREINRILKPDAVSKPPTVAAKSKPPRMKKKAEVTPAVAKRKPVATWVMLDRFFFQASASNRLMKASSSLRSPLAATRRRPIWNRFAQTVTGEVAVYRLPSEMTPTLSG